NFRFEPESTMKLAKRRARIYEIPISYSGRTYDEGKKINWRDGYRALWAVVKFGFSDDIYKRDLYGSQILAGLSWAHRHDGWVGDTIRQFCGNRGVGIGRGGGTSRST